MTRFVFWPMLIVLIIILLVVTTWAKGEQLMIHGKCEQLDDVMNEMYVLALYYSQHN